MPHCVCVVRKEGPFLLSARCGQRKIIKMRVAEAFGILQLLIFQSTACKLDGSGVDPKGDAPHLLQP